MASFFDDRQTKPDSGHALRQPDAGMREAKQDAAAFLAAIVESSADAIISKNLNGIITTWNNAAERLFGYTAGEAVGQPVTILIPDDRLDEEPDILARIHAGERIDHFETIRQTKDGRLIDISLTISPIRNSAGAIIGASKIARDISEKKRAAEHRELLLSEMRHRVKNLFAITGSIITLSARTAETPADLATSVRGKLLALSRAHELTFPRPDGDAVFEETPITLFELLSNTLAPYEIDGDSKWHLHGDDLQISPAKLTKLALLFHEFATNAAKYGCLSVTEGRLDVTVSVQAGLLELHWLETNGPEVPEGGSQAPGFGNRLEQLVVQSLQAEISRDWRRQGLSIRLVVPTQALAAD